MNPNKPLPGNYEFNRAKSRVPASGMNYVKSYPSNKLVTLAPPENNSDRIEFYETLNNWLLDNKVKYTEIKAFDDGSMKRCLLFKKTKDAIFCKLGWG